MRSIDLEKRQSVLREIVRKFLLFIPFWVVFLPLFSFAQIPDSTQINSLQLVVADSLQADTLQVDSLMQEISPEQALRDSLRVNSDLKEKVRYKAKDSIVFDVENDVLYLYGDVEIEYESMKMQAEKVRVEWESQTMFAEGVPDSAGNMVGTPIFTESGQDYDALKMSYNFKTQKGRVVRARTTEGDGYLLGDAAKRTPDGVFCIEDGKFTTCNADHPHFYVRSKKLKVLPSQQIVSGPLNIVIEDFPVPIVLPFGYFPNKKGQRNGIILPQYGEAQDRGFFLRGLGYYRGINEHLDVLLEGDIYTKGGWRLGLTTRYKWLPSTNGTLSFEYGVVKFGEKTDPNFSQNNSWFLKWNHQQKINPGSSLTASVDIGASRFLRQFSYGDDFFNNNLRSSIAYNASIPNTPFSLSLSANHSQDLNQSTTTLKLPEVNISMARQFPFKRLTNKNLKWLKNLGFSYAVQGRNELLNVPDSILGDLLLPFNRSVPAFKDTILQVVQGGEVVFIDTTILSTAPAASFYRNGISHNIPLSTSIKIAKFININPSFNYREYWYFKTIQRTYVEELGQDIEEDVDGFQTARDFNFSLSASTNFYGLYGLPKSKREVVIRQRFTPTVSYNFKPDFSSPNWGYYDSVQVDTTGRMVAYNRFQGGIYGSPSSGESQSMSFGLQSVLEMKYRKKESFQDDFDKESQDLYNRIRLLDNLSLNGSYNFAADSFKLSTIRMAARTQILDGKLNVNANATLDPYMLNGEGRRIDQLEIAEIGRLGRITNARVSVSTAFRSKNKKETSRSSAFDEEEFQEIQRYRQAYLDFTIPWSVNLSYDLSYSKSGLNDPNITQAARLRGDFNFSPKWKLDLSTGFDFKTKELTTTQIGVYRDLHCWEMSFSWTPFGIRQGFLLTINVKSATLQDLKVTKRNDWRDRFRSF